MFLFFFFIKFVVIVFDVILFLKYMIKDYNIDFGLNKFFQKIVLKKQYVKVLKNKIDLLHNIKEQNYKSLNSNLFLKNKNFIKSNNLVTYIIYISFSRANTLLHVMNSSGILKFSCSAGNLSYKGNSKKARVLVLKSMINLLIRKVKFLRHKFIALHLKNVKFMRFWIVKRFKKKFFIQTVKNFNLYPYNGCRKKKVRRKKFKKKINKKRWLSGLKRQIVNLLSFLIAGSNPALFIF